MLYVSPFEVLGLSPTELREIDRKTLLLKKKQLLAEFDLTHNITITLKSTEFSRNDIITLFDQLEGDGNIVWHTAIAQDAVLLKFLQTGEISSNDRFADSALYTDPAFIAFISPFYKAAFKQTALKRITAGDFAYTAGLFANPVLLNGNDYDTCFGILHSYLEEKVQAIDALKESFATYRLTDLAPLPSFTSHEWVATMNRLPDAFAPAREDYTIAVYNLAVDLWNAGKKDLARILLYGAQDIESGARMKAMVSELIVRLSGIAEEAAASKGKINGHVIWYVIMIIFACVRVSSTCNQPSYNSNPYSVLTNYDQYSRTHKPGFSMGFMPFIAQTKRDSTMLYLMNSLYNSLHIVYKNKKTVPLETGDDPYKAVFAQPVFLPSGGTGADATVTGGIVQEESIVAAPQEDAAPATLEPGAESTGSNTTIPLLIENKIMYECVVFFFNRNRVFSVYLKPYTDYTIQLEKGGWRVFGYGGKDFSYDLEIRSRKADSLYGKRKLTRIGRFNEFSTKMLECMKPSGNLNFTVLPGIDNDHQIAKITIDFKNVNYFNLLAGRGIIPVRGLRRDNLSGGF